MNYIKVAKAAEKWGISARRVRVLCAEGKIDGVVRQGKLYMIPEDALKPNDGRKCESISQKGSLNYKPKPINTDGIQLSEDVMALCELIAKNTHEVWAEERIKDGWVYGEKRNDDKKQHPCLLPYEELSETEKKYDRNTSIETLKLIIKLGYDVKKSTEED